MNTIDKILKSLNCCLNYDVSASTFPCNSCPYIDVSNMKISVCPGLLKDIREYLNDRNKNKNNSSKNAMQFNQGHCYLLHRFLYVDGWLAMEISDESGKSCTINVDGLRAINQSCLDVWIENTRCQFKRVGDNGSIAYILSFVSNETVS